MKYYPIEIATPPPPSIPHPHEFAVCASAFGEFIRLAPGKETNNENSPGFNECQEVSVVNEPFFVDRVGYPDRWRLEMAVSTKPGLSSRSSVRPSWCHSLIWNSDDQNNNPHNAPGSPAILSACSWLLPFTFVS
jgi:hypothetical protein